MVAGITGPRKGMNDLQESGVRRLLIDKGVKILRHGDCIGSDARAHHIALDLGLHIFIHPPTNEQNRAFCVGATHILLAEPYHMRDRNIVDKSHFMIATPDQPEYLRSGTWTTIRYAWRTRKDIYVIWPDGSIDFHEFHPTQLVDF